MTVLVLNDVPEASRIDHKMYEIRKREHLKSSTVINIGNILKGNIASIVTSLVKNPGQIVSKAPGLLAKVFGYSDIEEQSITNIHSLMPR